MSSENLLLLEHEQEVGLVYANAGENVEKDAINNPKPKEPEDLKTRLVTCEQGLKELKINLDNEIRTDITQLQNQIVPNQQQIDQIQQQIDQIQQQIVPNQQPIDLNQQPIDPNQQKITNCKYLLLLATLVIIFIVVGGVAIIYNLINRRITNLTWEKNQLFNQLDGFELIWRENDPILETILDVKDLSIKTDILFSGVDQYSSVLLVGGLNDVITDTVIVYNSDIKDWQNCQLKLPTTMASHGAVLLKSDIYILGGYVDELQQSVQTVYKLGQNNQWTNVANMSIKRSGISQSTIVYNSDIWVIGGRGPNFTLKAVEKFNPETNTWQKMASMYYTRAHAAATVINGKIYVSGGWNGSKPISSVEVFDPVKNYWEVFKELPHDALDSHTALTDRTSLIIIGGRVADSSPTNEVWKINVSDPKAQWIKMNSLVQGRYYHGAAKLKDQMMVIGGMGSNKQKLNSVEMVDDINWTAGPKLPIVRTAFATIPLTKKYEEFILTKYKCFS